MKTIFVATLLLFAWILPAYADDANSILVVQEKAFSDYSAKHGFRAAFVEFGAEDMEKLDPGSMPVIGKEAVLATLGGIPPNVIITWVPSSARISHSKDMGYTYGIYTASLKLDDGTTTKSYGKYFTVWQKNSNGVWKVVLDGGNSLPKDYAPDS